jgi:hypothetical protein
MATTTRAMRLSDEIVGAAGRKGRELGLRTLTDCVTAALREWAAGDSSPSHASALAAAERRAESAERELARACAELARLRDAPASAGAAQEERFIIALKSATTDHPVPTARLNAVSGWSQNWVSLLLTFLVREGYITRVRQGWYAHTGGTDLAEGIRTARAQAQYPATRIAPGRRERKDGPPPAPVPAVPAEAATAPAAVQSAATVPERSRTAAKARAGSGKAPLAAATPAAPPRKLAAQRAVREAAEAGSPRTANGQAAVIAGLRETVPGVVTASELPGIPVFLAGPDVDCAHENMRIRKGVCPDCKQWVTK